MGELLKISGRQALRVVRIITIQPCSYRKINQLTRQSQKFLLRWLRPGNVICGSLIRDLPLPARLSVCSCVRLSVRPSVKLTRFSCCRLPLSSKSMNIGSLRLMIAKIIITTITIQEAARKRDIGALCGAGAGSGGRDSSSSFNHQDEKRAGGIHQSGPCSGRRRLGALEFISNHTFANQ